jgi:hypothetical protein
MARRSDLTPSARSLRARAAAYSQWAGEPDRTKRTEAARAAGPGRLDYWLRQVDPEHRLADDVRQKMAESARKAHYARLAYRSARARAARKAAS